MVADLGGESGDDLEAKYMGICRLSPSDRVRRIGEITTIKFRRHPELIATHRHFMHPLRAMGWRLSVLYWRRHCEPLSSATLSLESTVDLV